MRLPALRKMAQEFVKNKEWKELVQTDGADDVYFEEAMLRGMLIGYGTAKEQDNEEAMRMFDKFVPFVDNWSVCDSFCNSMTIVSAYREEWWEHLQSFLASQKEFEVRLSLVLLLSQFLKWDDAGRKIPRRRVITEADIMQNIAWKSKNRHRMTARRIQAIHIWKKFFQCLTDRLHRGIMHKWRRRG